MEEVLKNKNQHHSVADSKRILIVDDDIHILEVLEARLVFAGFEVIKASHAQDALTYLKQHPVDLMICDMKMPDISGFTLFEQVMGLYPELPVIFLTAYGTIPDAVRAMKAGAVEYLTKPFDGKTLVSKINDILSQTSKKKETGQKKNFPFYLGDSPAMKKVEDLIQRVSSSDVNVLIFGESGVGKERVARLIHELGPRCNHEFVAVDCGSTPSGLLESELFGHVKGSFTHAIRDKKGLIEIADRGTLFLDEIGNISQEMQVRLLRFLEEKKIRRIGDVREIPIDCRIIAATNSNLVKEIRDGQFREDLFYRLRVVTLTIPPLRDRKEDIPGLAQHFIDSFCKAKGIPTVRIHPKTMELLCQYPWPGNVRELKNTLEASIVLCTDTILRPEDIQLFPPIHSAQQKNSNHDSYSLEENERNTIIRALKQTGGVQKAAADLLGISRRAIHYKIKKYGISVDQL